MKGVQETEWETGRGQAGQTRREGVKETERQGDQEIQRETGRQGDGTETRD